MLRRGPRLFLLIFLNVCFAVLCWQSFIRHLFFNDMRRMTREPYYVEKEGRKMIMNNNDSKLDENNNNNNDDDGGGDDV